MQNDYVYIITQNLNKNLFEIYLEKLKDFALKTKNANMFVHSAYCDFGEGALLPDLIAEFEKM